MYYCGVPNYNTKATICAAEPTNWMCTNLIQGVVIVFAVCQKIADNNAMWADEDDEVVQFAKLRRTTLHSFYRVVGLSDFAELYILFTNVCTK